MSLATQAPSRATPTAEPVERTRALVAALAAPRCYFHPAAHVEVLETHISFVLLAGPFAYKIKKPVRLPFVDYSTLDARRRFCEDEVRLNTRTAPELYLGVVPITGSISSPSVGGAGTAIEYAVRMQRFDEDERFERLAVAGALGEGDIDALAQAIARLHDTARRGPPDLSCGSPETALGAALDNFRTIRDAGGGTLAGPALDALEHWTQEQFGLLRDVMRDRQRTGFVRECHGDLHLGNVVRLEGRPVLFDCIEFNASFRWIDVMSDVAFAVMDLHRHGHAALAARLLDGYLERTGDYDGLRVLRFYLAYRALVRAKVSLIRACQPGLAEGAAALERANFRGQVALAARLSESAPRGLVVMHGLSGSGKTTVSQVLTERLGAVRLRSDVVRKAQLGLDPLARTHSGLGTGAYGKAATAQAYAELASRAVRVLRAGYTAIVDATFLERAQRDAFRETAKAEGVPFAIVDCEAPDAVLRERVGGRMSAGDDPSEADIAVLESQMAGRQSLGADETASRFACDTSTQASAAIVAERLAAHFRTLGKMPCATSTSSTVTPTGSARSTS